MDFLISYFDTNYRLRTTKLCILTYPQVVSQMRLLDWQPENMAQYGWRSAKRPENLCAARPAPVLGSEHFSRKTGAGLGSKAMGIADLIIINKTYIYG